MASIYQEQHYEDVARFIADVVRCKFTVAGGASAGMMGDWFADLFAADNPPTCQVGHHDGPCSACCLVGGFNRKRFLKACGLEDA